MPTYANIGGSQKELESFYANIGGAQKELSNLYANVGGAQKEIFGKRGGVYEFSSYSTSTSSLTLSSTNTLQVGDSFTIDSATTGNNPFVLTNPTTVSTGSDSLIGKYFVYDYGYASYDTGGLNKTLCYIASRSSNRINYYKLKLASTTPTLLEGDNYTIGFNTSTKKWYIPTKDVTLYRWSGYRYNHKHHAVLTENTDNTMFVYHYHEDRYDDDTEGESYWYKASFSGFKSGDEYYYTDNFNSFLVDVVSSYLPRSHSDVTSFFGDTSCYYTKNDSDDRIMESGDSVPSQTLYKINWDSKFKEYTEYSGYGYTTISKVTAYTYDPGEYISSSISSQLSHYMYGFSPNHISDLSPIHSNYWCYKDRIVVSL